MSFIDKLINAARQNNSLLCIGLDPDPQLMPDRVSVSEFNRGIIDATGAVIDIDDDGEVKIASPDGQALEKALEMINALVEEPEVGKVYDGKVKRIVDFGAFVEILPGKDGLLHISEIEHHRINSVRDVLKEGDELQVKVIGAERDGKIRLSRKALLKRESRQG